MVASRKAGVVRPRVLQDALLGPGGATAAPFWTLFNALPVGAVLFALEDDGFVAFNDAACAQLGYTREQFARLRLGDIDVMYSTAELLEARLRLVPGAEPTRFHTRQRARDGSIRSVDVTVHGVQLGGRRYGYAVWHDVTDREQALRELREREAELARVQRIGRVGGFEIDFRNGMRTRRSPEHLRLHGLPPESVDESHEYWVRRLHPEDRERMEKAFRAAVASDARNYANEYRIVTPAGETRWVSSLAEIERDEQGRALRMIGAHIDITALKSAEAQLAEHAQRLRETDRRKDEFLAMLSHELRNPLAPLVNALALLMRRAPAGGQDAELVQMAQRQVRQLTRLVDDLLDVSRISHGKVVLRPEPIVAADVLAAAIESCAPAIEARGQTLAVDVSEPAAMLHADPARIVQVLENLLHNAAKYTAGGGRIRAALDADADTVTFTVADNGVGIPAAALASIFELFIQVDSAPDRVHGGLGIGLALVDRLVRLHGGHVRAHSDGLGKGATFAVTLPRLRQGVQSAASDDLMSGSTQHRTSS
ncbi:MAG TPA: ATP-binding protein [Burkholderiaceae bacterium]|nr:ATP-binding protein [Burkholderiaceae bacterium]